jgi:hypothetical protein
LTIIAGWSFKTDKDSLISILASRAAGEELLPPPALKERAGFKFNILKKMIFPKAMAGK